MGTLRVRFRDGSDEDWPLHDRMKLHDLRNYLFRAQLKGTPVCFGIASPSPQTEADYGYVSFTMADVLWWELDGLVDMGALLIPWAKADGNAQEDDGDDAN